MNTFLQKANIINGCFELWTVQHKNVSNVLDAEDIYTPSIELMKEHSNHFKSFERAYNWLIKQANKKLGYEPNGLVWYAPESLLENYKEWEDSEKYQEFRCLIPVKETIAIDSFTWYFPLNNAPVVPGKWNSVMSEDESKKYDALYAKANVSQKIIEKSWQHIFNTDNVNYGVEYVANHLKKEWIVNIT